MTRTSTRNDKIQQTNVRMSKRHIGNTSDAKLDMMLFFLSNRGYQDVDY
jgi:hypothetical protein